MECNIDIQDLITVNDLWHKIYPYLATQVSEIYGRVSGQTLELGPFAGGLSYALATSHKQMDFTIADCHDAYLSHVVQNNRLHNRVHLVATPLDRLPFADESFDLVLLRGAFFFIMDSPQILREIYRVLALGGVAFVGGGYGRNTPQAMISAISDESRILNDKLGRQRITLEQLHALLHSQNLEQVSRVTEEGGVWLIINKRLPLVENRVASISSALKLAPTESIALVGGGGKTSLMFRLAHELASDGRKVISTTTTRICAPSAQDTPCLIVESKEELLIERLIQELPTYRHVTLALDQDSDGKLKGLPPETLDRIYALHLADYIVNEADGAGGRSIKAPRPNEPVVQSTATLVVALVGLDILDEPLSLKTAFRIEFIERLTGITYGNRITEEALATLLSHQHGIIQNVPPNARIIPLFNKSELVPTQAVYSAASAVLARRHTQIKQVTATSLQTQPPIYRIFHSLT